jgi:hypothetical protein
MKDITERLRDDLDTLSSPQLRELCEEAAVHIEELRTQFVNSCVLLDEMRKLYGEKTS